MLLRVSLERDFSASNVEKYQFLQLFLLSVQPGKKKRESKIIEQ
jgi:hypothetical protein